MVLLKRIISLAVTSIGVAIAGIASVSPAKIVQLDQSGGGGITTNPNIQNIHHNVLSIDVDFDMLGVKEGSQCQLTFNTSGKNSESDWVAFLPDGFALVDVFLRENAIGSPNDHHDVTQLEKVSTMNVTRNGSNYIKTGFNPNVVSCSKSSQLLLQPGKETIILGWQQPGPNSEGLKLLVQ